MIWLPRTFVEATESAPGGVNIGVLAPDKLQRAAKGLVPPGQGCVDNVLAIPAHRHKAAIGVVGQRLGVQVTRPQVLDGERQPLSIL